MDLVPDINIENTAPLVIGNAHARDSKHTHPESCQNCGAKLAGKFCQECGQQAHVHRSVLHVIEEVFHGITHFDSRTWRSMPMLAFRPGTLTREYVMGKRARYVPPFAMFLFSIFAMFLAFAFSGGPGFVSSDELAKAGAADTARLGVLEEQLEYDSAARELTLAKAALAREQSAGEPDPADIAEASAEVAQGEKALAAAATKLAQAKAAQTAQTGRPKATTAAQDASQGKDVEVSASFNGQTDPKKALAEIQSEKAEAEKSGDRAAVAALSIAESAAKAGVKAQAKEAKQPKTSKTSAPQDKTDFMTAVKNSMREGDFTVDTPWPSINEKIKKKFQNPDLFIYKMQNTVYKFSFLLVPLSLPFLWLMLFWKKGVTLFDHAVFSLYSLSFVSFLFLFISLAAHWYDVGPLFGAAACILPAHIFFQFKGAYALKWFSALWRTLLFCGVFAWVIITLFTLSIVVLGATG